jgi:hypothetical protein
MQRSDVIHRLGQAAPGIRSAPGTTAPPAKFDAAVEGQRGDHDLNPGMVPERTLTGAAVLVPLIERADGMTVLLTKRTDHLHDHAGQVSFPGGRIDPEDRDAAAAALR